MCAMYVQGAQFSNNTNRASQRSSEPVLEHHVIPRAKVIAVAQTKTLTEITVARPKLERDI